MRHLHFPPLAAAAIIIFSASSVFASWSAEDYAAYNAAVARVTASYGATADSGAQLALPENLWNLADNATYVSHTWTSGAKQGQTENLIKVVTWAWNYDSWTQASGTEWTLSAYGDYGVFPWVTLGGSDNSSALGEMQFYFRQNYSRLADESAVYDKVWHSLGMSQSTKGDDYTRVLVEFLVSPDDLIRPSYYWDPQQTPGNGDFSRNPDGSFAAAEVNGLVHDLTLESNID